MANEEPDKSTTATATPATAATTTNQKVPPIKIVLSSTKQNNAVVNITRIEDNPDDPGNQNEQQPATNADPLGGANVINSKEHTSNANQRITRSSQRAAQQNKTDNSANEQNGDDSTILEIQDKGNANESVRKVKRRKGEPQESEQDVNPTAAQATSTMANIYPTDYQLPTHNSFQLYRDIRKRPYKKLMKLNLIQPRVPHGFKDYLLNGGPYLLDGNKLGYGLNGAKYDKLYTEHHAKDGFDSTSRVHLRTRLPKLHQKYSPYRLSQHRYISYNIPKESEAPKSLPIGSPLYELFLDQEKARHQMRMHHLKERERSILAAEQEILRAYNKAAMADAKQELHLSACTYFYYQERYHYSDEKTSSNGTTAAKEVPHSQDNSFLCIEGREATKSGNDNDTATQDAIEGEVSEDNAKNQEFEVHENNSQDELGLSIKEEKSSSASVVTEIDDTEMADSIDEDIKVKEAEDTGSVAQIDTSNSVDTKEHTDSRESDNELEDHVKSSILDEDLKVLNKKNFLDQLQEIDEKWDKIKKDMLVRHRNEADSLHAVQTLEWEWKAKEIGACDVRVSLKVEPEFVPKVQVTPLDY